MKFLLASLFTAASVFAQLNSAELLKPPADSWPTFNGDYSGRRFSPLKQIDETNVQNLALAWATRFNGTNVQIKSTPLLVNGVLYFTSPNTVWAADARTGREIWHYQYPPNTGSTIGNRGVGIYGNWLYFESPDSNLVSLDARTGKEPAATKAKKAAPAKKKPAPAKKAPAKARKAK